MPTKVKVPPKIAAKDKGNNSLPGFIKVFFLMVLIRVATTAVLLISAEAIAVLNKVLTAEPNLEPLINTEASLRKTLVRSKANEHKTRKIKVIKPGFTAFAKICSELTNEKAKHTNEVPAKTRSGLR